MPPNWRSYRIIPCRYFMGSFESQLFKPSTPPRLRACVSFYNTAESVLLRINTSPRKCGKQTSELAIFCGS